MTKDLFTRNVKAICFSFTFQQWTQKGYCTTLYLLDTVVTQTVYIPIGYKGTDVQKTAPESQTICSTHNTYQFYWQFTYCIPGVCARGSCFACWMPRCHFQVGDMEVRNPNSDTDSTRLYVSAELPRKCNW